MAWVVGWLLIAFVLDKIRLIIMSQLRDFRVDINKGNLPIEMIHELWPINVLKWSNYGPPARPRLIMLYGICATLVVGWLICVFLGASVFEKMLS
jgi:hypothetical protein